MTLITHQQFSSLLNKTPQPPCISIYQPTYRAYPESQKNAIAYRQLVDEAEEAMQGLWPVTVVRPLLERLHALESDPLFWTHRGDGLAVLASPEEFYTFDVRRPVPKLVFVAESFHLKPLIRTVQSADRFHLLCLQRDKIRLYEGNRDELTEIEPADVPFTVTNLGEEIVIQSRGPTSGGKSGESRTPAPREPGKPANHPAKGDDAKFNAEQFFRAVDWSVLEQVSKPTGLPLILAALPEDLGVFRSLSFNPHLAPTAIECSPAGMSEAELLSAAWQCFEPYYTARLEEIINNYRIARPRQLASEDLQEVDRAAHEGRVGVLLVEADINGVDKADRDAERKDAAPFVSAADDRLDDLAELVLSMSGTVVVVPHEQMPTHTGLAATYRY